MGESVWDTPNFPAILEILDTLIVSQSSILEFHVPTRCRMGRVCDSPNTAATPVALC